LQNLLTCTIYEIDELRRYYEERHEEREEEQARAS
jgi:hypothetical protein